MSIISPARLAFCVLALALAAGCGRQPDAPVGAKKSGPSTSVAGGAAGAAPSIRTIAPLPQGEWATPLGDLAGTRFSPLDQITPANVANLKVQTTLSTGIPHGHEG